LRQLFLRRRILKLVYLDNAASTKISARVVEKMMESYSENYGNPSSTHKLGQKARATVEKTRNLIAGYLGVEGKEIIFTSGGAEGNNLIIRGALNAYDYKGKHIITSKIEHSTVLKTCQQLEREGYEVTYIDVDENGVVNLEQLKNSIRKDTVIVSIMYANNETGVKQPIKEIGEILENTSVMFHTDAVQAMGKEVIFPKDLKIDAMTVTAHKFYGPKGAGFVYLDKNFLIEKEIWGGSQERNRRAGTENVVGIVGLGKALELSIENLEQYSIHIQGIKDYAISELKKAFPNIKFNGQSSNQEKSLYTVLSLALPFKNPLIGLQLDIKGIAVSQGSACSSGASKPSMVLMSIQTEEEMDTTTPLRVSFSSKTTKEDIDKLISALNEIVQENKIEINNN